MRVSSHTEAPLRVPSGVLGTAGKASWEQPGDQALRMEHRSQGFSGAGGGRHGTDTNFGGGELPWAPTLSLRTAGVGAASSQAFLLLLTQPSEVSSLPHRWLTPA